MSKTAVVLLTVLLVVLGATGVLAATLIDLDASNSGSANGALFFVGTLGSATGTGVFNPFLHVSSGGGQPIEQGYNSDYSGAGWPDYDQTPSWTKALLLSEVPVIKFEGNSYREFVLDVNQVGSGNDIMISLDQLKIFASTDSELFGWDAANGNFDVAQTKLYDLGDYYVKINASKAAASGSGTSDVTMLLPESMFAAYPNCGYGSATCGTYLYFWTRFGDMFPNNDGFEEWATLVRPTVKVTKTAVPSYTQPNTWDISKSVTPAAWQLFTGESGESQYTVKVTKTAGTATNFVVSGSISVQNTTGSPKVDTILKSVTDVVGATSATVTCPVTFPYTMAKGETVTCTYTASPAGAGPTTKGTNTATATLSDDSTFTGTADYDFAKATPTPVNGSISVTDTNGQSWGPVSDTTTWTYKKTFTCDADKGKHDNTASIDGTAKSASASVTVDCYKLSVEKDATPYWERAWTWTIKKTGDQTALKLLPGETFVVNYEVTVDATKKDSGFAVSGNIKVINSTPLDAVINGVADVITPAPAVQPTVNCGVTFPYTLGAGKTLTCTYSGALPDATARVNKATATQQLYNYPFGAAKAKAGTTDYSGSANITFTATTDKETDECIDVTDSVKGALGKVCAGVDTLPKTFKYSLTVGPYELAQCGDKQYPFDNCASFVTNDSKATDKSCWEVLVTVPCPGCTLTQGYWKTHSTYGKATINQEIYDKTWGYRGAGTLIPQGEETIFFNSGQTWGEVMWTPPAKGNAYYILAHQWIAAYLNVLNGATLPATVGDAWNAALTEFKKASVTPASLLTDDALREKFIMWAGILGNYNEGLAGVPHCDDTEKM